LIKRGFFILSKFTKLIEILEHVSRKNHGEYGFVDRHGKPIKSFRTAWDYALKKAGIKNLTFHSLRHTNSPLPKAGLAMALPFLFSIHHFKQ
jgi:integrase